MKKFWLGFRSANYIDENKVRVRREAQQRIQTLLEIGGHEAESEFCEAVKRWRPTITQEELKEMIKQFHDAVSERQWRDQRSY